MIKNDQFGLLDYAIKARDYSHIRPILGCGLFEFEQDKATVVTSDGYHLHMSEIAHSLPKDSILIGHSYLVQDMSKLEHMLNLKTARNIIKIEYVAGEYMSFVFSMSRGPQKQVNCRLYAGGRYPDYKLIIPAESNTITQFSIPKNELIDLDDLDLVSAHYTIGDSAATVTIKAGKLEFTAKSEARSGKALTIAFRPQYMRDAVLSDEDKIDFNGEHAPIIVRGENRLALVMPVSTSR